MNWTRLILVRHGHAQCNVSDTIAGSRTCKGLTDRGREQAALLADRLVEFHADEPITAIYSTRTARTKQTAEIVANGLQLSFTSELHEPDYGDAEGRPWKDVIAEFGQIFTTQPHLPMSPNAESWSAYIERTGEELVTLAKRHPGSTVVVVGHHETMIAAAHSFLHLSTAGRADVRFAADHTSLSIWQWRPLAWSKPDDDVWHWAMMCHNDTGHIPARLSSR